MQGRRLLRRFEFSSCRQRNRTQDIGRSIGRGSLDSDQSLKSVSPRADRLEALGTESKLSLTRVVLANLKNLILGIGNDPSAGSPTETLLRLLLPLNAQVWESSPATSEALTPEGQVQVPH